MSAYNEILVEIIDKVKVLIERLDHAQDTILKLTQEIDTLKGAVHIESDRKVSSPGADKALLQAEIDILIKEIDDCIHQLSK